MGNLLVALLAAQVDHPQQQAAVEFLRTEVEVLEENKQGDGILSDAMTSGAASPSKAKSWAAKPWKPSPPWLQPPTLSSAGMRRADYAEIGLYGGTYQKVEHPDTAPSSNW